MEVSPRPHKDICRGLQGAILDQAVHFDRSAQEDWRLMGIFGFRFLGLRGVGLVGIMWA